MAINFRSVSSDEVLEPVGGRGRKQTVSEFAQCTLGGLGYVLTEGVDYLPDSSEDETLPKLSSVRQRIGQYAKTWSKKAGKSILSKTKGIMVKVKADDGTEMKIPSLHFWFEEGERKARAKRTKNKTEQSEESEQTEQTEQTA